MSTVSKGVVLIADDNPDDIFLVARAFRLSKLDYSLVTVEDGEQAIAFLTREPRPALLLLDLKMPGVSGFDVLQWLQSKEHLRELPVVVFSSSDWDGDKKRAKDLGAKEYIVKSGSPEELLKVIADLNARFLVVQECSLSKAGVEV